MSLPQELDHLKIPLDDIKAATNNFSYHNFLGQGGFGRVYRGQLSLSTRSGESISTIAVKRLDVKGGQGAHEFSMEIVMLSSYKHDNLVSLIGFVDEGDEKLLVLPLSSSLYTRSFSSPSSTNPIRETSNSRNRLTRAGGKGELTSVDPPKSTLPEEIV
nr:probable receptor-like protein kinase At5g59700 [Tanacetum cinerariifolium]